MEEKIERLSENFDFIEEAYGYGEPLVYTDKEELVLSEAVGNKSPFHILGKLSGVFAPIGEFSRNRRIYAPNHWNKVIESEDVQNRLKNRSMFGMIGHEDAKVTDERIREGLISHIVTKMEVREDMNGKPFLYGELEILDTPAGRILKAMHEGGAGLYVSSRGAGKLVPIAGDPINKMVSPDSFYLETWDIVKNPGFLKAKPVYEGVAESKETIKESYPTTPFWTSEMKEITKPVQENSEVAELKGQINKLAKIIEKVVDDVYEIDEDTPKQTLSDEERIPLSKIKATEVVGDSNFLRSMNPYDTDAQVKQAKKLHGVLNSLPPEKLKESQVSEAMDDFLKLLSETNITDEAASDIFDIIFNKKEEK